MGNMDNWRRVGAISGFLGVVLVIVGAVCQGSVPFPNDSAADIKSYFVDNGDEYLIGDFFYALAFVFFFLPFVSVLSAHLAGTEGDPPVYSRLILVGGAALVAAFGAISGIQGSIAYSAAANVDDNLLKTLVDIQYYTMTAVFAFLSALIVFCTSVLILRKGAFWPWLGWLGIAYTVVAIVSDLSLQTVKPDEGLGILTFLTGIVFGVWVLILSYGLWKASSETA